MKKKKKENLYVVRKMVKARSLEEALKKEKQAAPLEIIMVVDNKKEELAPAIGFSFSTLKEED